MTQEIQHRIDELTRAIDANPADADAIYRRGALLWKLGQAGPALSDFNRAAELDPSGPAPAAARGLRAILDFHLPQNP